MPIPSPQERPDLYDDYDGRQEAPRAGEKEYWDAMLPDYMKQGQKPAAPSPDPAPDQGAEPENKNPA